MQRVGWIRIGALGDLLVGLASLRETLDKWPNAKVSIVGPKLWLQLIEPGYWMQIDRIAVVEKRGKTADIFEIENGSWVQSSSRTLRDEMAICDVVFNARVDSARQGFAALFAGVSERWGSGAGLANFIYNRRATHDGKDPLIHERDVPLLLMDEAEAREKGDPTFLRRNLKDRIELSPRIRKWRKAGLPASMRLNSDFVKDSKCGIERYFVVNPTSSRREKAWPAQQFAELLRRIRDQSEFPGLTPIVVGSPTETEWLQEVAGEDFKIIQPVSLGDLFHVIAGAEFLLTNTSSVQFVAASVGTKTLTLMGRAKPEIWGPLGPSDRFLLGKEPLDVDSIFERELKAYESISLHSVLTALRDLSTSS